MVSWYITTGIGPHRHPHESKRFRLRSRRTCEFRLGEEPDYENYLQNLLFSRDYHQKFALRTCGPIFAELQAMYPDFKDILDATAATRVDAYLNGNGTAERLGRGLPSSGCRKTAKGGCLSRFR
jgi:hypothetical protein